jgi:hypothetical protein
MLARIGNRLRTHFQNSLEVISSKQNDSAESYLIFSFFFFSSSSEFQNSCSRSSSSSWRRPPAEQLNVYELTPRGTASAVPRKKSS